ncbi:MAG TPA: M56 family metallopeptidase [Steroidobacteraceae bacterium]|jgi:beta-lactamase regulating signal transducer with metallopeptidase domain
MHVQLTHAIYYAEVHLVFCSVVWLAAWALTSLPGPSATTKHWIWAATALNFVLPVGAVVDALFASHISWATPLGVAGVLGVIISDNSALAASLAAVWLVGALAMLTRLWARILRERLNNEPVAEALHPEPRFKADGIDVKFDEIGRGPAVTGLFRSRISLPLGIDRVLSERELKSVLLHELTHARRRDNLIRLLYEASLCALWFHPLVWLAGSRLALYRELSCDESVIREGHGEELVSALAKLARSDEASLLRATASSFLGLRLSRLTSAPPSKPRFLANALLSACFAVALAAGILATIAHTACCFVAQV